MSTAEMIPSPGVSYHTQIAVMLVVLVEVSAAGVAGISATISTHKTIRHFLRLAQLSET